MSAIWSQRTGYVVSDRILSWSETGGGGGVEARTSPESASSGGTTEGTLPRPRHREGDAP
jgi:hypothetical protein